MQKLRFGILSTAHANNFTMLPMAGRIDEMEIAAVASRGIQKAKEYAARNGIRKAFGSYEELVADPDIDCAYISMPNSMHKEWSVKALRAGKHVLCEKPLASNEKESREIEDAVRETGRTFAEAFHYRYHPLADKLEEIIRSGRIGNVVEIDAAFNNRVRDRKKPQLSPELGGGALMDTGCYLVSFSRWISGCDEADVVWAKSTKTETGVDGTTAASLRFKNGIAANIVCSIDLTQPVSAFIRGDRGSIFINRPFCPGWQKGDAVKDVYFFIVQRGLNIERITVPTVTSYHCQLKEFCRAVAEGRQTVTDAGQGTLNMRLIDAIRNKTGA
ncbi:MAG TPA: Gfo/Idh/MocA family oxidoreductase [bacterium]|nr:MAG: 1,5-anhydro-D-fructose reductase [bacterium ADurb.Bin236]HOY64210.1 Gfo/Idh/MocA family oxidoreductase [bacterium]HPI76329.1 Gfo/Idh/MocA family oxidoreductase [bacterium]HPN95847.1 Gfo/Idh/MocA family oxidoreductase [bacterium]